MEKDHSLLLHCRYTLEKGTKIKKIEVNETDFKEHIEKIESNWKRIGEEWPAGVRPIFAKFEDLLEQPEQEVKRLLADLSCDSEHVFFRNTSERQNPAPIDKKVTNYHELPEELRNRKLNVKEILLNNIKGSCLLQMPTNIPKELIPDQEPDFPPSGWRYPVARPYIPAISMQNVFDAIQSGSISSAGYWPKQLASRLRTLFRCPVAQPCSNGFTALMLAMQTANIGDGDEVIVPTMTMVAVPNAVRYVRATPVFADNAHDCYNPKWADYEKQSTSRTKAIVVTHTYGVPASDIDEIATNCKSRGWVLIEDISECVGVTFSTESDGDQRLLGTFGDFAIASLYANKLVNGGDGGFVVAKDASVGKRLTSIVNHGFTPRFHFVHFEQSINAKIHGIGAAIATGCFDELDEIMKHRSLLAQWYRTNLQELREVKLMPQCGPRDTPWVFGLQCQSKNERTKLRQFLAEHKIETRDFFFNLHLQPIFVPQNGLTPPSLPNAEQLGSTGFYLPTHSELNENDVQYICDCVKLYFASVSTPTVNSTPISRKKTSKEFVQVEPSGFSLSIRKYRDTGELITSTTRAHVYINAVNLGLDAENVLLHERYGDVQLLLAHMKKCLSLAKGYPLEDAMRKFFMPYIKYFESQEPLEQPIARPWLSVNLKDDIHKTSQQIPTTTDTETLQLLVWIIQQQKPNTIWEIGSFKGHASVLMSEVCSHLKIDHKIFACDAFRWQAWMNDYVSESTKYVSDSRSFLEVFAENVASFSNYIQPVVWPYEMTALPTILNSNRPQFVFLDISQDEEDLEHVWSFIESLLIPNETIILVNGLRNTSIAFFTRHSDQLKPLAKPHAIAKAFRFTDPKVETVPKTYEDVGKFMRATVPMKRSLRFHRSPAWDHHHNNLFNSSIEALRDHLHSSNADIIFVAAVDEVLCNNVDLFHDNDWIGIIHGTDHYPELFYTPDLRRLCTNRVYIAALKNCKGLFTLTSFQANFLRKNLPKHLPKFPIQRLHYPIDSRPNFGDSLVPQLMKEQQTIDLVHIGSFARDFQFFYNLTVPSGYRKVLLNDGQDIAKDVPADLVIMNRLTGDEYEEMLRKSIVILTLRYEGAANTLILECISRNVPILSPNASSCTDYLGSDYPLLYDRSKPDEIESLFQADKINDAIAYLKRMDKVKLSQEKFVNDVKDGVVLLSLPPNPTINPISAYEDSLTNIANRRISRKYDVTICICSYKRTHNLGSILEHLWNQQDFVGSYEIIVWNNNANRVAIVREQTKTYVECPTDRKSMTLINSTENYYCSIRFALAPLMKSDCLLICDDDIIPGSNFISFFHAAHRDHPKDVLCVRGHTFFAHDLDMEEPKNVWTNYDHLKFKGDEEPEQLIHFVHADCCLIPRGALQEIASVSMPDPEFALVDDYWMSYILNHKFDRNLRKLSVAGLAINPIHRTDDSEKPGLALHTRPEVQDARLRLYVHHMLNGWPQWDESEGEAMPVWIKEELVPIKNQKQAFWDRPAQIGYNINSELDVDGVSDLVRMKVKCVRIGAVGIGERKYFELSGFRSEPVQQLESLAKTVTILRNASIDVIITLQRSLATPDTWRMIARKFLTFENVVGYDLINEPFTNHETDLHWSELESSTGDPGK